MMGWVSFKMIPPLASKKCLSYQSPWFVAKDACKCLDLGNPSQAIARLEDDERWLISNEALRANGETAVVSEPGLYSLVLGSRKPEAKAFKRWVNYEALQSICKTGRKLV